MGNRMRHWGGRNFRIRVKNADSHFHAALQLLKEHRIVLSLFLEVSDDPGFILEQTAVTHRDDSCPAMKGLDDLKVNLELVNLMDSIRFDYFLPPL